MNDAVDPMLELVNALPDQLAAAPDLLDRVALPNLTGVHRVALSGMGGSAAAGELVAGMLLESRVPLHVVRDYRLPGWIDDRSLLIFSSYSGDTEETLSAYRQATQDYPSTPRIVLSCGGALGQLASGDGTPWVSLPDGLPPRASLGYGIGTLVGVLDRTGLCPGFEAGLGEAQTTLRAAMADHLAADGSARRLARRLYGKLPVIYSACGLVSAAASRWRAQLNENAKCLAYTATLPELDHNEIVGWSYATRVREDAHVITLRDRGDHPRVQRRFELTREVLGDRVRGWDTVESTGESLLARALSLVQYGDYLSVYLAMENGVAATPVEPIQELKQRLRETSS